MQAGNTRRNEGAGPTPMSAPTAGNPSESRISRIARRAHEIYLARGGEHGKALEDWLQAEREIDQEMETQRGAEGSDATRKER